MPKLMAIIAEDGWSIVRDGEALFFLRPPFRAAERVPIPESALADAVALHGYKAQPETPDEPWASVIDRIRAQMVSVNEGRDLPSNEELLSRLLQSGPPSVLTALLDKVEHEWLARGDMRPAERALQALIIDPRVYKDRALSERAGVLLVKVAALKLKHELLFKQALGC